MEGLIGRKIGMTQIFDEKGFAIPVTIIEAGPCSIVDKKTSEKDGYEAVQLGFIEINKKKINSPMKGYFEKRKIKPCKILKEFRINEKNDYNIGDIVNIGILKEAKYLNITSISIGKGFQGTMKRHNFSGGPSSHGSTSHRKPGSIGMCVKPGETKKGQKMAGRTGGKRITVRNLEVVKINEENNLFFVKGAVPGHKNTILFLKKSKKAV
ncbi:MAG: 50S ribosomal protein L3 [Deferribacterota bacterium]|nr:50S ribosomal protein L3 [Deferribacterota bacterium]